MEDINIEQLLQEIQQLELSVGISEGSDLRTQQQISLYLEVIDRIRR